MSSQLRNLVYLPDESGDLFFRVVSMDRGPDHHGKIPNFGIQLGPLGMRQAHIDADLIEGAFDFFRVRGVVRERHDPALI